MLHKIGYKYRYMLNKEISPKQFMKSVSGSWSKNKEKKSEKKKKKKERNKRRKIYLEETQNK